ncbi:MAG: MBL fold metallo-hydrolase [Firmicutes bacterium]|nr:MBL fold metallo-hydrolase [Bacillota bacterium]
MQLNRITGCAYYIDAGINIGVIVNRRREALLVDAGIDDSVTRKVKRLLEAEGFKPVGILVTHAHADHYGGAAHLVKAGGVRVYAPAAEKPVLEYPLGEPVYLFSGAYPPAALRGKFFQGPRVEVDQVIAPGTLTVPGFEELGIEVVDLAGHSLGQVGAAVDGVLFCADAVIAPGFIEKHGIPLNAHLGRTIETYDRLRQRKEHRFLPAHGTLVEDVVPLVEANRSRVEQARGFILDLLETPRTVEEVVTAASGHFGLEINNLGQYCLTQLTVMAYLSHLLDSGEIVSAYRHNRQLLLRNLYPA